MSKKIYVDAVHPEETRVVVVDSTNNRVSDFDVETTTKPQIKGNIYLAKVIRVEASLQAAFVDYGSGKNGFLPFSEIHPDYYQVSAEQKKKLIELAHANIIDDDEDPDDESDEVADYDDQSAGEDNKEFEKRAREFNKKVFKPCPKEHPRVLDYCYVVDGNRAVPFRDWLKERKGDIVPTGYPNDQKSYALAAIDHVTDTYALYYEHLLLDQVEMAAPEHEWRWAYGVVADEEKSCDIQLCSIPKGLYPVATLFFNKNAYSHDCAEHTKYWKWVEDRNEERYAGTIAHGKGYDAKNVMHCIRLLMTAKDIAEKGVVTVDRSADREFLFRIKRGEFEYDEVVKMGNELCEAVERAFEASTRLMPEVTCRDTDRLLHWMLASLPDKFNHLIISEMDFDDDEADT